MRSGDITVGELTSYVYLFTLLVFPLRLIGFVLSELPYSLSGWQRVREVLDEPLEPDPGVRSSTPPTGSGSHSRRHVHVRGRAVPALRNVDLVVPSGRIVAVVGPTGPGKSTLVELIGGLIAPDRGTVAVAPGRRSIVFQEAFLFAGTVRENGSASGPAPPTTRSGTRSAWRGRRFVRDLSAASTPSSASEA